MGKILLFSDIHIAAHKNSSKRLQHCLDALKWVFETAINHNIKSIIFLGDLFQDREKIQVLPYQKTYEILAQYCGGDDPQIKSFFLVGNHDMWFSDFTGISSVIPFGALKGIDIISQCSTLNIEGINIDFLPYTLNAPKSLEHFNKTTSPVLCGHIAIDGAQLNTVYKTYADVSVEYDGEMVKVNSEVFQPWKKVYLGHYHGAQIINNIEYVGSPLQINFSETNQEKHLIILDTETMEQEYVINDFSPQHLIIQETDIEKYNLDNAFIKIITTSVDSANVVDIKNKLTEKYNIHSIEFSPPKAKDDKEAKVTVEDAQNIMVQDRGTMLEEYLKACDIPQRLNSNRLLEVGKNIVQKSQVQ